MKNLLILFLALILFSCEKEKEITYSIINGTVKNTTSDQLLIRGNDFDSKITISSGGNFSDTLQIEQNGFYELVLGRERTEIYLQKGKNLTVNLNAKDFDESLQYSGDLGNENNYLASKYLWNEQHSDYKDLFSLGEAEFMTKLDSDQKSMDSLYGTYKISNDTFKKMIREEEKYYKAASVENYVDAHRYYSGVQDYQVGSNFYKSINDINFKDTVAYRNSVAYQNMLEAHFNRLVNEETYESGDNDHTILFLKKVDSDLPSGYAKDRIMGEYLTYGLKPDKNLDEAFNIYKSANPNSKTLSKLTERYEKLKTITEGKPSPTFTYENHKGGTTSLSDLKGKYVYIDVWATWCGPCLREIPALKESEKNYRGKNIQFVSISIDEPKDYLKWKEMVTEKELVGMQLMADNNWKSKFVEDFGILGIPRFILIDPQGNIVSADAPRPSDPQLKVMLDNLL